MPASPPPPGPPESPQADRTLADNLPVRADSLVVEGNLRSGQSVRHLAGDVSIVGSVASGAEVVAGGSVHVYGTLRGRAVAGAGGGAGQIFCLRLEAEVLVINDAALVADDMAPALLGRAVRAVREGEAIRLHPMG
jgi:septum site-determining protein MinC